MAEQDKKGNLKPGPYADSNRDLGKKQVEHVDVNNKREPKPIKTTTQRLKKLRQIIHLRDCLRNLLTQLNLSAL